MSRGRGDAVPRACAAAAGLALLLVLSLRWFTVAADATASTSGWAGLSPYAVAFLIVAAVAVAAGRGAPALGVTVIACVLLAIDLLTLDHDLALRWPAYAGIALAADLLWCAAWAWRAR